MLIRHKPPRELGLDEPLRHPDHAPPVSRREMIARLPTGLLARDPGEHPCQPA